MLNPPDVGLPAHELKWTETPVTGLVLLTAETDSGGNAIDPDAKYWVAKHQPTGKIVIVKTEAIVIEYDVPVELTIPQFKRVMDEMPKGTYAHRSEGDRRWVKVWAMYVSAQLSAILSGG